MTKENHKVASNKLLKQIMLCVISRLEFRIINIKLGSSNELLAKELKTFIKREGEK